METIVFCFGIVLELFLIIVGVVTDHYSIRRKHSDFGDTFTIPKSLCLNSSQDCAHYGALKQGKGSCTCKCQPFKPTFTANGSDWSCVDDTELRYKTECAIKLMSERDNQISTLSVRGGSLTSIVGLGKITGQECDADMTGCLYKFCNGSWFPLERREAEVPTDMFRIIHRRDGRKFLHLKVSADSPPQQFYGRVMKLAFTSGCRVRGNTGKTCLLIKLQGHVDCEAPKPKHSTAMPLVSTVSPTPKIVFQPLTAVVTPSSSTIRLMPTKSVKFPSSYSRTINYKEVQTASTHTVSTPTVNVKSGNSRPKIKMENAMKVLPVIIAAAVAGGIIILLAFLLIAKFRR